MRNMPFSSMFALQTELNLQNDLEAVKFSGPSRMVSIQGTVRVLFEQFLGFADLAYIGQLMVS